VSLLTVRQFAANYPWPSQSALRALIYHNKIDKAVVRSGRRVLINEEKFFEILQGERQEGE